MNTYGKHIVSLLLALLLMLGFLPGTAFATSATCEDPDTGLVYTVYSDSNTCWIEDYNGTATELVIPETLGGYTVSVIDESAFAWNTKLVSVTLPDCIERLCYGVFENCTNLTTVNYPLGLKSCGGMNIFAGCKSLTSITVPEGVTDIPKQLFSGASYLEEINLPSTLETIQEYAFENCTSLKSLTLPDTVTFIGQRAFSGCKALSQLNYPASLESCGTHVYAGCAALTSMAVPEGVTELPQSAFANAKYFEEITLPSTLETIGKYAFSGCEGLKEITIPAAVTDIVCYAFSGCDSLENIYFLGDPPAVGTLIFYYTTANAYYPEGNSKWTSDKLLDHGGDITWQPNHSYESVVTAPTCTAGGYTTYTCACGESYVGDETAATGHSMGQWYQTKAPTETANGENRRDCANCSHSETQVVSNNPFTDVPGNKYYHKSVLWAYYNNITKGLDADTFGVGSTCTREQIVTFLWNAAGRPEPKTTVNPFKDVVQGKYYYKAVLWAVENGITKGMKENLFGTGVGCTRGQVVSFLWNAAGRPAPKNAANPFTDVVKGWYYYDAVLWAVEQGITSGTTKTTFDPHAVCFREQIVTFLYRAR